MSGNNHSGMPRLFPLNIGTVVFGILFIYILITVVLYITSTHIKSYTVTSGPLARNQNYTGIALYDEQLYTADTNGYVDYYAQDGAKIRYGGVIYGVSPNQKTTTQVTPDDDTLKAIQSSMQDFSRTFDPMDFHDVFSLKYQVEGAILNMSLTSSNGYANGSLTVGDETVYTAQNDGIVSYTTDGFESLDVKQLTAAAFDEKHYSLTSLKTGGKITTGDPVYRLIRSENWSLLIPLTSKQLVNLTDVKTIKVKFLKDGITQNASFSIETASDGTRYGKLDFMNGLIRYLDNRFIDIELVTNTEVGLKIPVTAIVTKEFYTIPDEYASTGGGTKSIGFLKQTVDRSGNTSVVFTSPTIYDHQNGAYYIDNSEFGIGDIIVKEGSTSDRYIVRDTADLEGVYSMNKGYAIFRKINIIDKNEDYCIVEKGTSYGIAQYDNIVEDASSVKESQITAK